ncbi:MAG: hypothetical protein ACR2P6_00770 [Gammaproteobacteria bacterium]
MNSLRPQSYSFSPRPACQSLLLLLGLLFTTTASADITLQKIQQANPGFDWKTLEKGQIVTQSRGEAEVNDAELVVLVGAKIPAGTEAVMSQLERAEPHVEKIVLNASSDTAVRTSLDTYTIPRGQSVDIEWFYKPVADGTFNANTNEFKALQQVAQSSKREGLSREQTLAAMDAAVRDILAARVNEYRKGGLAAVSPYDVDGEEIHPGDYLADSLQPLKLLQREESAFYKAFLNYPADQHGYENRFYATTEKSKDFDGSLTSLKHWMVDQRDGTVLIAERKFYISRSLDAMNTLIVLLEEGDDCYVFLLSLSFTQKVTGMGSFIAHKVGRSKVKSNILPMFEGLRAAFPE